MTTWSQARGYDGDYAAGAAPREEYVAQWSSVVGVPVPAGYGVGVGVGPTVDWRTQFGYGGGQLGLLGTPLRHASPVYNNSSWQLPGARWTSQELGPYGGALPRALPWGLERAMREESSLRLELYGPPADAIAAGARVDEND